MKALIILSLSFVTVNVMAGEGNFNCSSQSKNQRNSLACTSSLVKDETKLALNCPAQVRKKNQESLGAN